MNLNFPDYAQKCIEKIEHFGFEAFYVGGCVRDAIMNRKYSDIDIATNAHPDITKKIFDRTLLQGIKHGTVTVVTDQGNIEVTTYRTDGLYQDSRHPSTVNFVGNIEQDLSRRDFTINALAYNKTNGLVDLFGGINDINNRTIRTVGDPSLRFSEDALRIIRCFRFASVLDFKIEPTTHSAAKSLYPLLEKVSGERILTELIKLASGTNPSVICDFINSSALEFCGIGIQKYENDAINKLHRTNLDFESKLALFISMFEHDTSLFKERLKPSNNVYKKLFFLDLVENQKAPNNRTELKQFLSIYGKENLEFFLNYLNIIGECDYKEILSIIEDIYSKSEPYKISHLAINGDDLRDLGYSGEKIGFLLETALNLVITEPKNNTKKFLLAYLKKM